MIDNVVLSPNALLSIIDTAEMHTRPNRDYGFLMGIVNKNTVEVKTAYPVYELDSEDICNFDANSLEQSLIAHQVAIDNHTFVGWYVTNPNLLEKTSQLFKYFDTRGGATVHLLIDLTLSSKDKSFNIQTFVRKLFGIPTNDVGCACFVNIPYTISKNNAELTAMQLFVSSLDKPVSQPSEANLIEKKFMEIAFHLEAMIKKMKNMKENENHLLVEQVNKMVMFVKEFKVFFMSNQIKMKNDLTNLMQVQNIVDENIDILQNFVHSMN